MRIIGTLALILVHFATPAKATDVDLLLVLSSDVSASVSPEKFQLQRNGYATALGDPQVQAVMLAGLHQRIAITFQEWADAGSAHTVIPWTLIDSRKAASDFATLVATLPRSFRGRTALGDGILSAIRTINASPFRSQRKTIDIAGDGTRNAGSNEKVARNLAEEEGITINALVILTELTPAMMNRHFYGSMPEHVNPPGGLENYFKRNVITSNGFTIVARGHTSFGEAIRKKLITEVADATMRR